MTKFRRENAAAVEPNLPSDSVSDSDSDSDSVDLAGKLVSPGLVETHIHGVRVVHGGHFPSFGGARYRALIQAFLDAHRA